MKYKSEKDQRFESIYRSCVLDVYRACLFYSKDADMAEEATQQAFINYYERLMKMDSGWEPDHVKAYLIQSAKNLVRSHYRSPRYQWTLWENEDEGDFSEWLCREKTAESAEDIWLCRQERDRARGFCLRILEDMKVSHKNWYQVYYMMYYSEKTYEEITEILEITKEVLYSRLYRAKRWIRKHYGQEFYKADCFLNREN